MKKLMALGAELIGYTFIAFFIGNYVDNYFSIKGYGTFALVILMYSIWFYQVYKFYR